jgi:hypothetical protein
MEFDTTPIDPTQHFRFYQCIQGKNEWVCSRTLFPHLAIETERSKLCAVNRFVPESVTRWMLQRQLPSLPVRVQANLPGTW